jgi:hypothetical protein
LDVEAERMAGAWTVTAAAQVALARVAVAEPAGEGGGEGGNRQDEEHHAGGQQDPE